MENFEKIVKSMNIDVLCDYQDIKIKQPSKEKFKDYLINGLSEISIKDDQFDNVAVCFFSKVLIGTKCYPNQFEDINSKTEYISSLSNRRHKIITLTKIKYIEKEWLILFDTIVKTKSLNKQEILDISSNINIEDSCFTISENFSPYIEFMSSYGYPCGLPIKKILNIVNNLF